MKRFNSFKNLRKISLFIFVCFLPTMAMAELPVCEDIFTEPISSGHQLKSFTPHESLLYTNSVLCDARFPDSQRRQMLSCNVSDNSNPGNQSKSITRKIKNMFTNGGDYEIQDGRFQGVYGLDVPSDKVLRLYFDQLTLTEGTYLNLFGNAQNLIIYVKNHLQMTKNSHINGIVYVGGNDNNHIGGEVNIDSTSSITGAFSAYAKNLPHFHGKVIFNKQALNSAAKKGSLLNMCGVQKQMNNIFHIDYGTASSDKVIFNHPFPAGVMPLIFLMPTITSTNTNKDGPASLFIKPNSISETGFEWEQKEPPHKRTYIPSSKMKSISWIAISPGIHRVLTDKGEISLIAGSINTSKAIINNKYYDFTELELPKNLDVVLNQRQTTKNHCWLTSTGIMEKKDDEVEVALGLDASQVMESQCTLDTINREKIAYLAVPSGSGTLRIDGENVAYDFRTTKSVLGALQTQCNAMQAFNIAFNTPPTFVASKNSRGNTDMYRDRPNTNNNIETTSGDGGWLRRCQLTKNSFSMTLDEDTYSKSSRHHWHKERYSYIALGNSTIKPNPICRPIDSDDFNHGNISDKWFTAHLKGSVEPHIFDNRLRITPAKQKQAAALTLKRLIPGKNNKIEIHFKHYAWHNQKGDGGDGMGIIFSDASIKPHPGGFGGSMGYAPIISDNIEHNKTSHIPGFAGGWLGIAIDEFGNFSSTEGGKLGGVGQKENSVTLRGAEQTGYVYMDVQHQNLKISPPLDSNGNQAKPDDTFIVTLDTTQANKALVTIERKISQGNGGNRELIASYDILKSHSLEKAPQPNAPENFYLSFTGSTGGAVNNHEIDDFELCSIKEPKPIENVIDHFEFNYAGDPFVCAPQHITLKACKNSDCSQLITEQVTATLSPANGGTVTWKNNQNQELTRNTVTFSSGSVELYLSQLSHTNTVTLDVTSSIPVQAALQNTICKQNGVIASCDLNFSEAGFVISNIDKYANKPANITISAVKKITGQKKCQPTFGKKTKNLTMWVNYQNPVNPFIDNNHNQPFTLSQTLPQGTHTEIWNKGSSTPKSVPIAFDANGVASIDINYADAGLLNLNAEYIGSEQEDDGLVMHSTNGVIKSVPYGFCVTTELNSLCGNADKSKCNVYKKAGEAFPLAVSARAWKNNNDTDYCDNLTTPSFELPTPSFATTDVKLVHKLIAPKDSDTQLGTLSVNQHPIYKGLATTIEQSVSEVGVFQFGASNPEQQNYLNSSLKINTGWSQNTGRFVPAWYFVEGSISPACAFGNFSYMSEPFDLTANITALNVQGHKTQNYTGDFAKGYAYLSAESAVNQNLSNRFVDYHNNQPTLPIIWLNGQGTTTQTVNFKRAAEQQLDGPFNGAKLGINIIDAETPTVAKVQSQDLNTTSSFCTIPYSCNAKSLGAQAIRFGRITMDNVYGPETQTLTMPTYTQYWAGNNKGWQINDLDSCTQVTKNCSSGDCTKQVISQLDSTEKYEPSLVQPQQVIRKGTGAFKQGKFELMWQNIGTEKYRGKITAPLEVPNWLKFYWQWDDKNNNDENPRASAYFGTYRGNDKIIYWREIN